MPHDALAWDLAGIAVVIVGGTMLHFCFDWTGRRPVLAVFCPINESIWEHLKMAYWPLLAMTGLQMMVSPHSAQLPAARAIGFYTACALILGLYFLTAALIPHAALRTRLVIDGSIFVIAVAAGQCVSYALTAGSDLPGPTWAGPIALLVPAVIFVWTTFAPPRVELFRDQLNGGYGLAASGVVQATEHARRLGR